MSDSAAPQAPTQPARFTVQPINGGIMLVVVLVMFALVFTHPWATTGSNSQGVGFLLSMTMGIAIRSMIVALILSWVAFHLAKRSQTAASIVFAIVFLLFAGDGSGNIIAHAKKAQREIDAAKHEQQLAAQRAGNSTDAGELDLETLIEDAKSDPRAQAVLVLKRRGDWFTETVSALGAKKAAFEADGGYSPDLAVTAEALNLQIQRARELATSSRDIAVSLADFDVKLRAEMAATDAPKEYVEELLGGYYSEFDPEGIRTYFSLWEVYYGKGLEFLELLKTNAGAWSITEDGTYQFTSPEATAAYAKISDEMDAAGEQLKAFLLAMQQKAAEANAAAATP